MTTAASATAAAAVDLPRSFGPGAIQTAPSTSFVPPPSSSSTATSKAAAAAAAAAQSNLPRQPSRSRPYVAHEARTQASSSPSSLSSAALPTSHSWYYGQDNTDAAQSGQLTGQSPLRRAGSLKSSTSPGIPRPAGSALPRRTPSQGDTERARERARVIRERRLSATSPEASSSSSPIPRNELNSTERTSIYSPPPQNKPAGQGALPQSSSARSGLASSSPSPRKGHGEVNGAPVEMQTFARTTAQYAGPSFTTSYPSSSAEPTTTTTTTTTNTVPRARTRSNPTRYVPSGLALADPVPLDPPTSSAMRSTRSQDGSTLLRKGSTGSRVNGAGSSHRVDAPSGLTASASTESISSRGYHNGQQDIASSPSPSQQRATTSGNTAKIAPPASPPRKSSKSHKLTPKQLAKRKAEEANRRDREADEAAARAAVAAATTASEQNGTGNEDLIGSKDTTRPPVAHNGFGPPSDTALESDPGHLFPLGKPRKLDYGESPAKHRGPGPGADTTVAKIPRSTSALVNGNSLHSTSTGGRDDSMQFRLPTSASMSNRNGNGNGNGTGLTGPSKVRSASEPPTSAGLPLGLQRGSIAARAATIDWDEMIPPAIARRLAQEELLRRDPLLKHQEGLIDTWDRDGLPLTQVEIQVLAQDAVRREEGGGELDTPAELEQEDEGGAGAALPTSLPAGLAPSPPLPLDEIEMHDVRAQQEEQEAREAMQRQEEQVRRLRRGDGKEEKEEEEEEARKEKMAEEQREVEARSSLLAQAQAQPQPLDQSQPQAQPQAQTQPTALSKQQQQQQQGQSISKKTKVDEEKQPGCCAGCIVM